MTEKRTGLNNPRISIYEINSTTLVADPRKELRKAVALQGETLFPNGLYGGASFRIPRDATLPHYWRGGQRVVFRNGNKTIYEGKIIFIDAYTSESEQGIVITCAGSWGQTLDKWLINKHWANNKIDSDTWVSDTSATATAKDIVTVDRENRIRLTPSKNEFVDGVLAAVAYSMPTGETIKRIVLNREFQEKFLTNPFSVKQATYYGYDTATVVKLATYVGYSTATKVFGFTSPSTYTDLTNAYDGSTGTNVNFTLASTGYVYVRSSKAINALKLDLGGAVNTNAAVMNIAHYDGTTWNTATGLSDGTAVAGKMLAQDGVVSWTAATAQAEVTVNGYRGYWYRIGASANLTAVNFVEVQVQDSNAFTFTDLTNAFDGSTGTSVNVTLTSNDYLYEMYSQPHAGVYVNLGGTVNAVAATLAANYYQDQQVATTGLVDPQWTAVAISDGTVLAGKTLAQDGAITLTTPSDWIPVTVDGDRGYWLRFKPSANLTANITFVEVEAENPEKYTYTDLPNLFDGNTSTSTAVTLLGSSFLYLGFRDAVNIGLLRLEMTAYNTVSTSLNMDYWQAGYTAETGIIPEDWATASITDGTASGGKPLAQSGDITFTITDMTETTVDGDRGYWLRLYPSKDLTAVTITEVYGGITQAWELRLRDRTGSTTIWSQTTSGTGSQNDTLGTPRQTLHLELISKTKQRGEDNGSVYGQVSSVEVYSETGAINIATIAEDVIGIVTSLNSTTSKINTPSNPIELMPFITNGPETAAAILSRAASYGDADFNRWYCQLVASELAPTPNGMAVLEVAQYPSLTAYDYQVSIYQKNVSGLSLSVDYGYIANRITLAYTDEDGTAVVLTPDDNSSLADADSIALYDRRDESFSLGTASNATALNIGKRILATRKNPRVVISESIRVRGSILDNNGQPVPACEITAGKRLRVQNYLDDKIGVTGAFLTFILSGVKYDDQTETATLQCSLPDIIAAVLAQKELLNDRLFQA